MFRWWLIKNIKEIKYPNQRHHFNTKLAYRKTNHRNFLLAASKRGLGLGLGLGLRVRVRVRVRVRALVISSFLFISLHLALRVLPLHFFSSFGSSFALLWLFI